MSGVSPPDPSGGTPYKAEYKVSPTFRHFWETLFKNNQLTDKEVSQLTDQFVKNVWSQMSEVLNWALKQQKERNQKQKEEQGG